MTFERGPLPYSWRVLLQTRETAKLTNADKTHTHILWSMGTMAVTYLTKTAARIIGLPYDITRTRPLH